jgi:SagB-type dehydrogenase family enzyme
MKQYHLNYLFSLAIILLTSSCGCAPSANTPTPVSPPEWGSDIIELPEPQYDSDVSIEQSLLRRRSIRSYTGESLTLQEVAQLLWAAQGVTDPTGFRTAPSAGALYPLELYVVTGDVQDLSPGVYRYEPLEHRLVGTMEGDKRAELADAALGQTFVGEGALVVVFTAVYERTTGKYGDRGISYVHMEVGHAAQNLCLQAAAMDLGVVTVGAFYDEEVGELLDLPGDEQPLYVIPVGRKQ